MSYFDKPIDYFWIALIPICMVIASMIGGYTDYRVPGVTGPGDVAVQSGEYTSYYKSLEEINKPFLVAAVQPRTQPDNPIRNYHSQFLTFSSKTIGRYMKKCDGTKECTANFLNYHSKTITLYAANTKVAEQLTDLKQGDARETTNWDVINFSGQCIEGRTKIEKNGVDVTDTYNQMIFGKGPFRDCSTIYVTKVSSADMSVEAFMEQASKARR